jgi:hypothetical protein
MRKSEQRDWVWHSNEIARSPHHSAAYITKREMQLEVMDELTPAERELVCEYGFDRAMRAIRQFYGRWALAREALEAERVALQVLRWENTMPVRVR